jgi:hypothetical protein
MGVDTTSIFFLESNQTTNKEIEVQNFKYDINENFDIDEDITKVLQDYLTRALDK